MKISTRGRYALSAMIYLAKKYNENTYVSLNEISEKEDISLKYLEKIMLMLKSKDFFITLRGQEGGYRLKKSPENYKLGDILRAAEGNINVVSCVDDNIPCIKKHKCETYDVWKELNDIINDYLDSKTLKDFIKE